MLRAAGLCGAILEEDAQDIDVHALHQGLDSTIDVVDYAEHAMSAGGDARAAAYLECAVGEQVLVVAAEVGAAHEDRDIDFQLHERRAAHARELRGPEPLLQRPERLAHVAPDSPHRVPPLASSLLVFM